LAPWTLVALVGVALLIAGCSTPTKPAGNATTTERTTANGATSTSVSGLTNTTAVSPAPTTTAPAGLTLLVEPQAGVAPLDSFMSSALQSLDMTMYELSDPTAEQILIADHQRGVRVRVLLDKDYNGGSVNQAAYSTLSSAGVPVAWANGSEIFHQKTITVDGAESAIMTGNLTSQYYATTRDFVVMDNQAADVAAIESAFATDWSGAKPSAGSPGVDLVWSPGSEPPLAALIDSATRSVIVENEEMDSTAIEDSLESDAQRGVDVTVVMTADADWDSAFAQLESDGVHVVLYPDTSSALYIHAKVIDVDSAKAFLGSENFSTASLDYNRELGLITSSAGILGPLNRELSGDIADGQPQPRTSSSAPPAATTPPAAPAAPPSPTTGCYPIDNEGGCYKSGEYCRDDDHGATGRAGDGQTITCEDENGTWYWEST
jgi:phosphatidylserine/phosphatidylglycerophosphate/cardiolipin synthase-like enzyme